MEILNNIIATLTCGRGIFNLIFRPATSVLMRIVISCVLLLSSIRSCCFAQDNARLVELSKQIMEAKSNENAYQAFEELTDLYFNENKYNEFVGFLNSLLNKKKTLKPTVSYYICLARYYQLKHLEATQSWDEYFNQGNIYRDQLVDSAQKTIDSLAPTDVLSIYAKLILWKFHRDQMDTFSEDALSNLMGAISAYAPFAKNLVPLKDVATEFLSYGEKAKAKEIYKIYVERLVASETKGDELSKIALGFFEDGNLDLAEAIYDVYIEQLEKSSAKDNSLTPILIEIVKLFSFKDEGAQDLFYAEKIFKKIEEVGGEDILNEELIYLRAFNLEKTKDYQKAKDRYIDLLKRFPQTKYADKINFKLGIIYTYVLRDLKTGRTYFEKLANSVLLTDFGKSDILVSTKVVEEAPVIKPQATEGLTDLNQTSATSESAEISVQKEISNPYVISSLYQLGLLSQWENVLPRAKDYYNKLLEIAKNDFSETVELTIERLKEIEDARPIQYNLKTFLDVSLKDEYKMFDMTKLELQASAYRMNKNSNVNISSLPHIPESGCTQIELQYLWSGHLGKTRVSVDKAAFDTTYVDKGTKEINLVVVSAPAIIDLNIDMVDVQ